MSNADTHRRSADLWNSRDWDGLAADLAEDCELVDQARGLTVKGRQQWLELEQAWAAAFPDGRITGVRVDDAGSTTVLRFVAQGRNDGPLGPMPATGRELTMPFCEVREYDTEGKTVRGEWYYDQLSMLVQLGHMQPPAH
jgi:steroid delta-isomerase-like uncharacterized protein